ncbi:unnamed protein product [Paramecium primaurelia]|uniref:Uncharacterized protein n=1 Tax=Paramecium primaurelia TaxID=5886 RepID=A0A8S1LJV0_PARPR|nr:unnamed protein product [Paramecium primaurelia]
MMRYLNLKLVQLYGDQIIKMIALLFCVLSFLHLSMAKKCQCNEIYFEDLCRDARGCYFETKSGICEEINCLERTSEDCSYFAGKLRCYWDITIGFCQELSGCEELQENEKVDSNEENCQEIDCRWDYQQKICVSDADQRMCQDYDVQFCIGAIQVVGTQKSECVLNGENGDSCIALEKCEDITYNKSCNKLYCKWEDDECKTKTCSDYSIQECPSFNKLSQKQCYPSHSGCVEFVCSDFGVKLQCQNHPRCFWSQNLNSCHQQTCDKATYATQCLSFSYAVENTECKWDSVGCHSCYQIALVFYLIIYIFY